MTAVAQSSRRKCIQATESDEIVDEFNARQAREQTTIVDETPSAANSVTNVKDNAAVAAAAADKSAKRRTVACYIDDEANESDDQATADDDDEFIANEVDVKGSDVDDKVNNLDEEEDDDDDEEEQEQEDNDVDNNVVVVDAQNIAKTNSSSLQEKKKETSRPKQQERRRQPRVQPRRQDSTPKLVKPISSSSPSATSAGRHRWRPGTVALREIRKYQKTGDLLVPKAPIQRLVQELTHEYSDAMRLQSMSHEALQELSEARLVELLQQSNLVAIHSKRCTIKPKDIKLVQQIRGL